MELNLKKRARYIVSTLPILFLHKDDQVIVNTDNGLALGVVANDVKRCPTVGAPANLKKVVRKVTAEDLQIKEENEKLEDEARKFCIERIQKRDLSMKLIDVDCLFEKSKIIFYFTAGSRVDFRELVKDLVQNSR